MSGGGYLGEWEGGPKANSISPYSSAVSITGQTIFDDKYVGRFLPLLIPIKRGQ